MINDVRQLILSELLGTKVGYLNWTNLLRLIKRDQNGPIIDGNHIPIKLNPHPILLLRASSLTRWMILATKYRMVSVPVDKESLLRILKRLSLVLKVCLMYW